MDENIVRKTYKPVILVWIVAAILPLLLKKPYIAVSITLGMAMMTALLIAIETTVRKVFIPGAKHPKRTFFIVTLIKYLLLGLALYFIAKWEKTDMLAFVGGILLVHLTVFAKMIGAGNSGEKDSRNADGEPVSMIASEPVSASCTDMDSFNKMIKNNHTAVTRSHADADITIRGEDG